MYKIYHIYFIAVLTGVFNTSCEPSERSTLFIDLGPEETGLEFSNELRFSEDFNIIKYLYYYDGGGVAVGDINNDGLSDVYLVSNEGDNALFLNLGDLKFKDISDRAGVKSPGLWKSGVTMADVNGDGFLDIYLCRLGDYQGVKGRNELYINRGDLTFEEESEKYNLDFRGFSTQAAFFDMDHDHDLDMYLLNHSVHSDQFFDSAKVRLNRDVRAGDRIYRNDNNVFVDVSAESGIYMSRLGYGLGIGLSDMNKDGYTDIFIANDFIENDYLYLNNQDGSFREVLSSMIDYTSLSSMGCDLSDFNNDGYVDILTLDMLPEQESMQKSILGEGATELFKLKERYGYMPQYKRNMLQLNRGNGTFSEIGMMAGIHATDWSWAPLLADFDNDGWKDIFISNGIPGRPNSLDYLVYINRGRIQNDPNLADSVLFGHMPDGFSDNYFYKNLKDLTFEDVSKEWGVEKDRISNGIAYSDLDNDGDLDLILNNLNNPATIKENRINKDASGNFISIKLVGKGANTQAVGSKIELYCGRDCQLFEVFGTRGFKSSVDHRIHAGLGRHPMVDSMRIEWPDGSDTVVYKIDANQFYRLEQSSTSGSAGLPGSGEGAKTTPHLFTTFDGADIGIDFYHSSDIGRQTKKGTFTNLLNDHDAPALAIGDVNNDGLDDFYIGGGSRQAGGIFIQTNGRFTKYGQDVFFPEKSSSDIDAAFFDFDKDHDLDLLVVGKQWSADRASPFGNPRLYLNNGSGGFKKLDGAFKGAFNTGSCIAIHDFDSDGWPDVFMGSGLISGVYGPSPKSRLFKNNLGSGMIEVSRLLPNGGTLGMVKDAQWADLTGDHKKELITVGEWMEVSILVKDRERFTLLKIPNSAGLWQTVCLTDYEGDGDMDILAGNMGLNSKLKLSENGALNLYLEDFDRDGRIDPVMTGVFQGKESIFNTRDNLVQQIPLIGRKFRSYRSYAEASVTEVLGDRVATARKLTVNELRSGVFINNSGSFRFEPFPNICQISYLKTFLTSDFNKDGKVDILTGGNFTESSMREGRYSSGRGTVLLGKNNGYEVALNHIIGLSLTGEVSGMEKIIFQGKGLVLIARRNASVLCLEETD
ncbi:MAG: VCBS repeat-containing protein [Cytophagales bacterium]|nr:VCBS repeat-containing protein [Cytophagales bacterium]